MHDMLILISMIIFTVLLAYASAYISFNLTKLIDTLLDYKMIFWNIRYKIAYKEAVKLDRENELIKARNFADRSISGEIDGNPASIMADQYEKIAHFSKKLKAITCITCMTIRYNTYLSIIVSILLYYISWYMIPIYFLLNFSFLVKKMEI